MVSKGRKAAKENSINLQRRKSFKNPKKSYYIFTEGKKTEREYFREIKSLCRGSLVKIELCDAGMTPVPLVTKANKKQKYISDTENYFNKQDEFWVVFDRDEHLDFDQAISMKKNKGVHIAVSNPCFELWGLLHFVDQTAFIDRDKAQSELKKYMKSYSHSNNPVFDFELMNKNYDYAKCRAIILDPSEREDLESYNKNPTCNVYQLVDKILASNIKFPR